MKKFFEGVKTIQELKKLYFKLAKQFHPDVNPDGLETMQHINNEYDNVFDYLKGKIDYNSFKSENDSSKDYTNYTYQSETSDIFKDIISKIIRLEEIEIEICGYWIWISGNTKQYKDYLKQNGFYWASKKSMWYWRNEEYKSFNKQNWSIDQIRDKYGSQKIQKQEAYKIAYN